MDFLDHFRRIFSYVVYREETISRLPPPEPLSLRKLRGGQGLESVDRIEAGGYFRTSGESAENTQTLSE